MTQELPDLLMQVEVVCCPTACLHCWAMGRAYQAMPLEEISWVLHEVRRFCTQPVSPWDPMATSGLPSSIQCHHAWIGHGLLVYRTASR